jgi:hypothetical protein
MFGTCIVLAFGKKAYTPVLLGPGLRLRQMRFCHSKKLVTQIYETPKSKSGLF